MKRYFSVRRVAALIVIWLMLAAVFAFVAGALFRSPYDQLARNGVPTEGWITLKEPDIHQNVHYSFLVGSEIYSGIGHGGEVGYQASTSYKLGKRFPYSMIEPILQCRVWAIRSNY